MVWGLGTSLVKRNWTIKNILCEQSVSMLSNFMFNTPILEDLCLKREDLGQKRVQNYLASQDTFSCVLKTTLWHTKTLRKSKSCSVLAR